MKENVNKILLSPLFLVGLFLLLLNDFVLKSEFHNFFTGKLSDFAGLFIFPLFFAAFFPKRKLFIYLLTSIFFGFWKSPYSQSLIDFLNSFQFFVIGRTVDYTDLIALFVVPVSYLYFQSKIQNASNLSPNFAKRCLANLIIFLSVFAFTATSYAEDRMATFNGEYRLNLNKSEIKNVLKQNEKISGIKIERETDIFPPDKYPDVKAKPNVFFVDFSFNQKVCDSKFPKFHFSITEEKEFTVVKALFADFKCKEESIKSDPEELLKQYKEELNKIFEQEVIEKLRQNNSQ